MCVKKQIIDGSACRSGCKSPFVFCDSKSTEMKIEMTNKKEANCKVKKMTSSVPKKQNKTEMAFFPIDDKIYSSIWLGIWI